ncbi:hypothetical protein [Streptomyces sp. 7N604]|uniref:hypothetical protein n=1 Tax=Streptomyces sp. 7N604 TaxID=3457415 RepID=UPI003FD5803C
MRSGAGILPALAGREPEKPKPGQGQQIPVEAVAQQAIRQIELPEPVIHTSPDEDFVQVVRVPTWMWVDASGWGPVTETARVPGVKVTATARPRKAVWSMGEGGTVTCTGPGTPYSAEYRPEQPSPDCGYTYTTSSLGEPGRSYRVSVAVTWDVEWEGGGQTGQVPGLVATAERQLVVDEVQAIVAR